MAYNEFPFDQVREYLEERVNNNTLEQLFDQYNIGSDVEDKISALADVITDNDMLALRFEPKSVHDGFTEKLTSQDDSVNSIAEFLAHNVEEGVLESLMNNYKCFSVYDLALAITNAELDNLGYTGGNTPIDGSESEGNALRMQLDQAQGLAGASADSDNFMSLSSELPENPQANTVLVPSDDNSCCCDTGEDWNSLLYNGEYHEDMDFLEDIPPALRFYVVNADMDDDDDMGITFACDDEMDFCRFKEALDPTLVDSCEIAEGVNMDGKCIFSVKPHKFEVQEDVVLNKELNPIIFDENNKVKPEIRDQLIDYVEGFAKKMSDKDVIIDYTDICLVGSQAGYLYQPGSDLDVHLISAQQLDPDQAEKLYEEFDLYEAENPLSVGDDPNNTIPVELGMEDGYDAAADNNKNDRRYSLVDEEWVNDSDKNEQYTEEDLKKIDGYEGIVNDYKDKIDDVVDNDEFMNALILKAEIRQNRSNDLASQGAMSMGNVVFKELRNIGAYGKLKDYINGKKEEVE